MVGIIAQLLSRNAINSHCVINSINSNSNCTIIITINQNHDLRALRNHKTCGSKVHTKNIVQAAHQ